MKKELMVKPTNITDLSGKFLSLDDRVVVALRRLNSGNSLSTVEIVDTDMRFLDILADWPASLSDSIVLKSSTFSELTEEGKRLSGEKFKLSNDTKLREYIVRHLQYVS
ncbi:hypothetical protein HAX54_034674 [Datura stramonium]|uniref:Uncharacterized protein n=1 Tax=Datura stramonium TaxID=4076 RepID=A0ABS8VGZ7_DATST|nr:hypothetical protein [Datura stramonium]